MTSDTQPLRVDIVADMKKRHAVAASQVEATRRVLAAKRAVLSPDAQPGAPDGRDASLRVDIAANMRARVAKQGGADVR